MWGGGILYLCVKTLETAVDGDELVFLYQLKEGICQSSHAANIATLAGLPPPLVQRGVQVKTHTQTDGPTAACICTDWMRCVFLSRCLNSTGQESLSNALIQRPQINRQTGWFNFCQRKMAVKGSSGDRLWPAGADLWWRSSSALTWTTRV